MPRRIVPLEPENCYHIYNRGVNKAPIFFSDLNYHFFIGRMYKYLLPKSKIIAFCLMPNHFHLLLQVESIDFTKQSLQRFFLSYAKSINQENDRVGPLFQGRFQANHVDDEEYLLDCMKYIHINPVKAGLVKMPELWPYSSYREYLYQNSQSRINTSIIMDYFEDLIDFKDFVESEIEQYESKYFIEN